MLTAPSRLHSRAPRILPRFRDGKTAAAALLIAGYFLLLTRAGWNTWFDSDTMLNLGYLHGYGRVSLGGLLLEALTVFTPEYRPAGGLYYRILYAVFGLNPASFRIAAFVLLGLNLVLVWRCARQLSRSRFTASLATLLVSFHPAMDALYCEDGTIYDVLCLSFVLLAFNRYISIRREQGRLDLSNLLVLIAIYGAALGSKEMAVTFPAILLLYEVVFRTGRLDWRERVKPALVLAPMTALFLAWKVLVPNHMSSNINGAYTPHFRLDFIAEQYLHYYRQLWFAPGLSGAALMLALVLALLIALALRNRVMLFGMLFANLALLPVCVIPGRGGFVWYMPILGFGLYAAAVLFQFETKLAGRMRRKPPLAESALQAFIVVGLALLAYWNLAPRARHLNEPFLRDQQGLRSLLAAAKDAAPVLPHGSRILFEPDPADETSLIPLFLIRLGYSDPSLWVEPVLHSDAGAWNDPSLYAMTIRRAGSGFRAAIIPQPRHDTVSVEFAPAIVHRGQSVEARFPAALAGCEIDLAYRIPDDELQRAGVWPAWMKLDDRSRGWASISRDAERGTIVVEGVRACHGDWVPARGTFLIIP